MNPWRGFSSFEAFKEALLKRFNVNGIYSIEEDDEEIRLTLKPDVAEAEWLPFLRAFYKLRFGDEEQEGIASRLSEYDNLEAWINLAKGKPFESYQAATLYNFPIYGELKYDRTSVSVDYIILSLTGKIWMECYGKLFDFFSRLIQDRLSTFRLADGLIVDISE